MLSPDYPDRQVIRFPPLHHKPKSFSDSKKQINPGELVSAKSWLYYSPDRYYGFRTDARLAIASLTKIMSAMVSIQICQKFKIVPKSTYFKVTSWACQTIGTTASLQQNGWVSVEDLLYGMMLPSGNDAAVALCQNLGAVLYFHRNGDRQLIQQIRSIDLTQDQQSVRAYSHEFIAMMNSKARSLKMVRTKFANAHGLDHINNYSCCEDLLVMCQQAIKNQYFRRIVCTVTYKATLKFYKEGRAISRYITWLNTNKLLDKRNILGIKTGITNRAGGCLATLFQVHQSTAIIIVLGSPTAQSRFRDTMRILNFISDENSSDN